MEEPKNNTHVPGCKCWWCKSGVCSCGANRKFSFLRVLIVLALLALAFHAGKTFGGRDDWGYERGRMMYGDYGNLRMMDPRYYGVPVQTTVVVPTSTTTTR